MTENRPHDHSQPSSTCRLEEGLSEIRRSLHGLQFGSVQITVQDGVIVQIDRTEKRRIRSRPQTA